MSIHKITPFLSDIKTFFKNSNMTAAMQNISFILSRVKMTERDTLSLANLTAPIGCLPSSSVFFCFRVSESAMRITIRSMALLLLLSKPARMFSTALWKIQVLIGAERCGTYLSSYGIRSVFVPNINRKTYV